MEIYVDKLPENCDECPMCRCGSVKLNRKGRYVDAHECVFGQYKYQSIDDEIDTCPLKLIDEVRKQEPKRKIEHECHICGKGLDLYCRWDENKPICDNCLIGLVLPNEIELKDQRIAELEKALELACEHIAEVEWLSCPDTDDIDESEEEIKIITQQNLNHFISKAKEELKNEE